VLVPQSKALPDNVDRVPEQSVEAPLAKLAKAGV
jgi:hypothetical protein